MKFENFRIQVFLVLFKIENCAFYYRPLKIIFCRSDQIFSETAKSDFYSMRSDCDQIDNKIFSKLKEKKEKIMIGHLLV